MTRTITAAFHGVTVTHDARGEYAIRGRDHAQPNRPVVIHMTYEQMVDAREALTVLIDNPPAWTRAGRERLATAKCDGHYDDDHALTSGAGISEPTYCDGSCALR
jgi:hypothetical protein